ncbi:unnamed protein product [Penicillium pancosmium]
MQSDIANPPGVSIWCGKAYLPTNKSFAPRGALKQPPASTGPLLNIQCAVGVQRNGAAILSSTTNGRGQHHQSRQSLWRAAGTTYVNCSTAWTPLLPYSYYTTLANAPNPQAFINQGYNIIHLVPDATTLTQTFNLVALDTYLNACDQVGLWVMYDMRYTYQSLVSVTTQVTLIKPRKSLLLWYTGDEPDGHGDPLNGISIAYSLIKLLDPWHPVSVLLNCYNFYYGCYSAGADIILSDVYPIGVNTTWSVVYNTPCNKTYGRCGCDDCDGAVEDISTRLNRFEIYQNWLGSAPKPLWGVPQAFGDQTFYNRTPTAAEEVTMTMLSLNHDAKGIVMWTWPTTAQISNMTRQLGTILVNNSVTAFILGSRTVKLTAVGLGQTEMDVAGWRLGRQMLVSILSLQTPNWTNTVTIQLPLAGSSITEVLWGAGQWGLVNGTLSKVGGTGLSTDLIIVQLAPKKDTDGVRGIEDGGGL